jgi:hypothetical protein
MNLRSTIPSIARENTKDQNLIKILESKESLKPEHVFKFLYKYKHWEAIIRIKYL